MKQEDIEMTVITDPTLRQGKAGDMAGSSQASADLPDEEKETEASEELSEDAMTDGEEREADDAPPMVRTLEDIVKQEATEASNEPPSSFSLSKTLGGAIIARAVHKQMGLVLLIVGFLIIYITCRFMCQKQMVEIDRLEQQLVTIRYKAVVFSSALTEKSRESNIMYMLEQKGDSTLKVPNEPPYKINIPE